MRRLINGTLRNFQNESSKLPNKWKPLALFLPVLIEWPSEEQRSLYLKMTWQVCKSPSVNPQISQQWDTGTDFPKERIKNAICMSHRHAINLV